MFSKSPEKLVHEISELEFTLSKGKKNASPLSDSAQKERRNLLVICMIVLTLIFSMTERVYSVQITEGIVLDNFPLMRLAILALLSYQLVQYFVSALGDGVLDHYREMSALEKFVYIMRKQKGLPYENIHITGDYEVECQRIMDLSKKMRESETEIKNHKLFLDKQLAAVRLKRRVAFIRSFVLDSVLPFVLWFAAFVELWNY